MVMMFRWYKCIQLHIFALVLLLSLICIFSINSCIAWEKSWHHQLSILIIRFKNLAQIKMLTRNYCHLTRLSFLSLCQSLLRRSVGICELLCAILYRQDWTFNFGLIHFCSLLQLSMVLTYLLIYYLICLLVIVPNANVK